MTQPPCPRGGGSPRAAGSRCAGPSCRALPKTHCMKPGTPGSRAASAPRPRSSPSPATCRDLRPLSLANADEQRAWLIARLQPYRIEATDGNADGLLTAYYEPTMDAA